MARKRFNYGCLYSSEDKRIKQSHKEFLTKCHIINNLEGGTLDKIDIKLGYECK